VCSTGDVFMKAEPVRRPLISVGDRKRWSAGEFVNQSTRDTGLSRWTLANRSIENTDMVMWYVARFDALADDIMGPLLRVPHHPSTLARFGAPTVLPTSALAGWFRTEEARASFGGVAAHAFRPLHYPITSAIGLGILTAGHHHGWPVAAGGSQSITNALADLGGKIETGTRIETASQLPPADVTMFDLAPGAGPKRRNNSTNDSEGPMCG
jgi:hypothetical protein